jgi:phospholipid-binding lipoprotein MlaA
MDAEKKGKTVRDPFEKMNRKIMKFDLFLLDRVINPFIKGYRFIIPKFIRKMINNLGDRINDIPTFMYSTLLLDYKNSAKTLGVFGTNMTIGLFGLFDPAGSLNLSRRKTTFGDVLNYYGVGGDFYLVLPFWGPSTLVDGIGLFGSSFINPMYYNKLEIGSHNSWTPKDLVAERYFAEYIGAIENANNFNKKFIKNSFDKYTVVKNMYIENRNHRIKIIKNSRR